MATQPLPILGIETSCDETAAAVVCDGRERRSNVVASQMQLHASFGGVVPEIASRKHAELLTAVVAQAMEGAGVCFGDLGGIAVTHGPGLIGSLLVGVSGAKAYAYALGIPIVAVNHIEGHVYANELDGAPLRTPAVCLVASGGHTDVVHIEAQGVYRIMGWTRDDAAGEAFDKIGRLLGLPHPGGPAIDARARAGDATAIELPRVHFPDSFDFSFSGLKTAAARLWEREGGTLCVDDFAASFQQAIVDVLVEHTFAAARQIGAAEVLLAGGVAANTALRRAAGAAADEAGIPLRCPPPSLCTDNAAMIACAGHRVLHRHGPSGLDFDVFSALPLAAHV
ncbi:MAG: tRNA (adenosine(37)-N6)-threonylcarbamoyltransferase complex transferase subunit TsaD [Armatimonadota bacterium]|jgi:N6-L-threonylcarbamoyladenine synthase